MRTTTRTKSSTAFRYPGLRAGAVQQRARQKGAARACARVPARRAQSRHVCGPRAHHVTCSSCLHGERDLVLTHVLVDGIDDGGEA